MVLGTNFGALNTFLHVEILLFITWQLDVWNVNMAFDAYAKIRLAQILKGLSF